MIGPASSRPGARFGESTSIRRFPVGKRTSFRLASGSPERILAERYVGERIKDLDSLRHVTVNIHGYNDPGANEKVAFDSVDLVHEYIGHVALTLELVEPPPIT